ncbi:UDP-N-acetyl-D-galactosamine dehydrogenase [Chryseobacterium piscicola]|uniref:UDP-N-acetyl-D-galactosamine dehydrogenase n=1 Tax=Chryseobacterium piscicola TaxID=551459 RepID=A0A1N7NHF4_9FLAO|nr:nucleotide sugar dehydrogenase [Chryseobacterium piscicola]PQA90544.1 UDP-N-acetyl-D-galactosamine dehydrogenase [Chryseobacterium piscicola]SIS97737.1 UDP-N-acetyl-D-galactosamine dehydrogenase [Chryseobacterium piscicola]
MKANHKITVIGLGYVGLPLARLLATKYPVVGFDINQRRIDELNAGKDSTLEIDDKLLKSVLTSINPFTENRNGLYCSSEIDEIKDANIYIITVPTPVDKYNRPDLTPLYKSSETVGKVLKKGDIVIYESTVYPGVTEEECVPVLEKNSGLKFNQDFFAGYSPERINPGDKEHTVDKILKVTAGSTPEIGKIVDDLYKSVITAGTHLAPTIKVAEASKVIENSQRDVNIAFMNELAKIFSLMNIDTHDVLEAAGTKWNFLKFKPGLVGGHCIGVDPFYLAQKAQEIGYYSELILSARRLNDSMGAFVAAQVIKLMIKKNISVKGAKILNLGVTFKENCPDIRNSKVVDVIANLEEYGVKVDTYDPWANPKEVLEEYNIQLLNEISETEKYDAIILTVSHQEFLDLNLKNYLITDGIIYDVKGCLSKELADRRL